MSEVTTKTKHAVKQTFKRRNLYDLFMSPSKREREKKKLFNVKKVPVSVLECIQSCV